MNFNKVIEDSLFDKYKGTHFSESWYSIIIDKDTDGYYDSNILFKFRKKVIPEKLQSLAIDTFLEYSKKKHSNRGLAAGKPKGQKNARIINKYKNSSS